jgi:hypothetical protein
MSHNRLLRSVENHGILVQISGFGQTVTSVDSQVKRGCPVEEDKL